MDHRYRIATALVLSLLLAAPVTAQPLDKQAELAEARQMQWFGGAMMMAGAIFETLSYTGLANKMTLCSGSSFLLTCDEYKYTNWSVFGAGAGMTVGGAVLMIAGGLKAKKAKALPSIQIGPSRFTVMKHWSF